MNLKLLLSSTALLSTTAQAACCAEHDTPVGHTYCDRFSQTYSRDKNNPDKLYALCCTKEHGEKKSCLEGSTYRRYYEPEKVYAFLDDHQECINKIGLIACAPVLNPIGSAGPLTE